MAEEIEFSIMAPNSSGIQPLLDQFEAEQNIRVRVRLLAWDSAWSMFVRSALYHDGPDVSEVGTTWVGDLIGMNALRPFNAADLASLGKPSGFFPSAWQTAMQFGDTRVWSIPWMTGSRLIFYRPELFERIGIDPGQAFQTIKQFEETVRRLQASGVTYPWTVPTGYTHTTLLNVCSWVWAAGGDFLNQDGKATRFMDTAALEGMAAYFALGRYIAPDIRHLNGLEPDDLFLSNPEAALTFSGPWLFCKASAGASSGPARQIGVALPPGPPFVGGSNLIIWKYSRNTEAALKLIRFLTRTGEQVAYSQQVGLLPAQKEALESKPFSIDPFWQTAILGLIGGSSLPLIRLWGLVEDRLTAGLSSVWTEILQEPQADPKQVVIRHLEPIARRLDRILESG